MKPITSILTLTAAVLALAPVGAGAGVSAAARHFEGTVVSVDRQAVTFRLRDVKRGTFRFKVTAGTLFERTGGFAGLKPGARKVEVTARRAGGRWIAVEVERPGGGGRHGGGADGRGGRGGADDPTGDDHGAR
jgi:hypothetical protein